MLKLVLDMTPAEIEQVQKEMYDEVDRKTLEAFKLVLAEALKIQRARMRMDGGYDDLTGQLRSSTGGIIFKDGKVLFEDFQLSPYGSNRAPGMKEGKELAFSQLRESQGWGIVLVAGKEYAGWVQAKGLSVLATAESEVRKSLEQAFNNISV